MYSWKACKHLRKIIYGTQTYVSSGPVGFGSHGGGAVVCTGGVREIRPLLYNISCVSKALTAMLPAVCVVLKVGGIREEDEGRGIMVVTLLVGFTVWFPLLQIQNGCFRLLWSSGERLWSSEAWESHNGKKRFAPSHPKKSVSTSGDVTGDAVRAVAIETVFVMVHSVFFTGREIQAHANECMCVWMVNDTFYDTTLHDAFLYSYQEAGYKTFHPLTLSKEAKKLWCVSLAVVNEK